MTIDEVIRRAVEWERERCKRVAIEAILDHMPDWVCEANDHVRPDLAAASAIDGRWNDIPSPAELGIRDIALSAALVGAGR